MQKITVSANEAGQRLDKLLGKYLSNAPMSFVYKMLRKKNIKLNGKKAQGNEKLTKGDQVEVFLSDDTWQKFAGAPGAEKQLPADLARAMESSIRLSVIYEDPDILILNKPSGMLSQKAAPSDLSLNEYMIAYLLKKGDLKKKSDKSLAQTVETSYIYQRGQGDDIEKTSKNRRLINAVVADDAALLFAKGVSARQSILVEDGSLYQVEFKKNNIDEILNAQNIVAIATQQRLNRILELRAYMASAGATAELTRQTREADE